MNCSRCNDNPNAPDISYITARGMVWHMEFVHNIEPLETLGQKTLRANQTVKETHDFSVDHGMNTKYSL